MRILFSYYSEDILFDLSVGYIHKREKLQQLSISMFHFPQCIAILATFRTLMSNLRSAGRIQPTMSLNTFHHNIAACDIPGKFKSLSCRVLRKKLVRCVQFQYFSFNHCQFYKLQSCLTCSLDHCFPKTVSRPSGCFF